MIFQSLNDVLGEIWQNRTRMLRVAWFDIQIENRKFYLGVLWKVISPLIQLSIFWFVFGIGIRGGAPVGEHPFFIWLLAGMVPWFYFNKGISLGASSINRKQAIIFKIKYPLPTIPVGAIVTCVFDHIIMLVLLIILYFINGIYPTLYWLNLLYYTAFAFIFLCAVSLVLSVVMQLVKDTTRVLESLLRLLFFLTPILWQEYNIPEWARMISSLNPIRYVVVGFRGSLLYGINFFERPLQMAIFWSMTAFILFLGCYLQKKCSKRFVDWM